MTRRVELGDVGDLRRLPQELQEFDAAQLDIAGVEIPGEMRGRSWRPLFAGGSPADWRTSFFCENFQDPTYPKVTFDLVGIRTNDTKYVQYPGKPEWLQLFDLIHDPLEMHNRATTQPADPKLETMQKELEVQKQLLGYHLPGKP